MSSSKLIAVVGGSGSGKSWIAARVGEWTGQPVANLCQDDFYRDLSHLPEEERALVNFDDPEAIDWKSLSDVLEQLQQGKMAEVPVYDFSTHTRRPAGRPFPPAEVVVLDGLWLLHHEWLREKFSLSVFVDCPEEQRLDRRIARDVLERGRTEESVRRQFFDHVQPMHAKFVEPQGQWATLRVNSPMDGEQQAALIEACVTC